MSWIHGTIDARVPLWLLAFALCGRSLPADEITLAPSGSGRGVTRLEGKVLDYTGRKLTLELSSGRALDYPAERVREIKTDYVADHATANQLFAQHRYRAALAQYQQALQKEDRVWVRRQILAREVWCYRHLQQIPQAVSLFLQLLQSDPYTPDFACIPLQWTAQHQAQDWEAVAKNWLASANDFEVLIGASYRVLSGDEAATQALLALSKKKDLRLAWLAQAQLWRSRLITADAEEIGRWDEALTRLPRTLRAGPTFVVAEAWYAREKFELAAMRLMQIPILHGEHRLLSVVALQKTGRALTQLGRQSEAATVYQEIVREYGDYRTAADEARQHLQALARPSG